LRTESVRNAITKDPKGANIKSLNQTMLSAISVPIPPIEEQLKIINRAEDLEKEIALIETELSAIDKEKKQVLTKYIVSSNIT
jgi:type I restriction enzyme M protein